MQQSTENNYLTDLYILLNDIFENFNYQSHGYKSGFYYAFNINLEFMMLDVSVAAQTKLLQRLVQEGVISCKYEKSHISATQDFMSANAINDPEQEAVWIEINPDRFNEYFRQLKKYKQNKAGSHQMSLVLFYKYLILRDSTEKNDYLLNTFKAGSIPNQVLSFLINKSPNYKVTRTILRESNIYTNRKLGDLIRGAIPGELQDLFILKTTNDSIQIIEMVKVSEAKFKKIVNGLIAVRIE